jgi:hypothetical protein
MIQIRPIDEELSRLHKPVVTNTDDDVDVRIVLPYGWRSIAFPRRPWYAMLFLSTIVCSRWFQGNE